MKILQIGYGNMGKAITQAVLNKLPAAKFTIIDPAAFAKAKPALNFVATPDDLAEQKYDIILFAVKPQFIADIIPAYKNFVTTQTIVLSILAGTKLKFFTSNLATENVLRIMPNLGAKIGKSINFCYAAAECDTQLKQQATEFISAFGELYWLAREEQFAAATAVAGSGPAYYFLLFKIFSKYLTEHDFAAAEAQNIALKTAELAAQTALDQDLAELITQVTSKGGTTEAALNEFYQDEQLETLIVKALDKAVERAEELS